MYYSRVGSHAHTSTASSQHCSTIVEIGSSVCGEGADVGATSTLTSLKASITSKSIRMP
jgi:hypothetical protein